MADEFDIIERLRKAVAPHDGVEVGIGDDAAVLGPAADADGRSLVTVDLLAEGTHFTIPPATARQIGRKALAVNPHLEKVPELVKTLTEKVEGRDI